MKKNWKRLLAACMVVAVLLGDSAFVYATEVTPQSDEIISEETVAEDELLTEEEPIVEEAVDVMEEEDAISTVTMELADSVIQLNYDVAENTWVEAVSHIILKSEAENFVIDEDYYADYWANFNSLEIVLYKDGEAVDQFINTFDFSVYEEGEYVLEATYAHSETEKITLTAEFSVVNGPRPYPLNKTIEWLGISNFNSKITYGDIKEEVKELLNRDIEERLYEGEAVCTEGIVSFKTTSGTVISDTALVESGNYIAVYTLNDESGKFFAEAESLVKITLEKMTGAGVEYSLGLEEEANSEKIAAAGVAYTIDGLNDSPYGSVVVITPKFKTPWGEISAADLKEYGIYTKVTGTVKENKGLLNLEANDEYVIATASGGGYGSAVVNITTSFYDEAGNTIGKAITVGIDKFVVVAGYSSAVKELYVGLKEQETETVIEPSFTTDGVDTYLVEKSSTSQKYLLDVVASGFADETITPKLTWKTSNSKLATISKDGSKITIPKNAQGVVDITATVKDNAKQQFTFKLMIVDLNVRMEHTKMTVDSSSAYSAITHIYPNLMAAKLKDGEAEVSIDIVGKSSDIFEMDYYDPETGEFAFNFINPNQKNGTYSLKINIVQKLNEMEFVSKTKTIQITNTKKTPKPTAKVTRKYNKALIGEDAYAVVLVNAKSYVDMSEAGIQLKDGTYLEVKDIYEAEKLNQWYVEIGMVDDAVPTKKEYKDKLIITYEDFRKEASVAVKIAVENKRPTMKVYGNSVYKPVMYTDLGLNTLDVLIDVPERMVELGAESSVSDGTLKISDATEVALTSTAAKSFEIVGGKYAQYGWSKNSKGQDILLDGVLVVTVKAKKSGTLQFKVSDSEYYDGAVSSKSLEITTKKASAETVKIYHHNTTTAVNSVTFSQNMLGKEILGVDVVLSDALSKYIEQTPGLTYEVKAEANDSVAVTVQGNTVKISAKASGFNTGSSKVKLSVVLKYDGTEVGKVKGSSITAKFVENKEPKITLTAKGSIITTAEESIVTVKPQMKNMPAGYTIAGVRFTNALDAVRFAIWDAEDINANKGIFTIGKREASLVPIGKNKVGITYRIRTVGGQIIEVPATVTVNVVEKVKLKASKSSITLYNSVVGSNYGKVVEFSDTLYNADIESIKFTTDLKTMGIGFEQVSEYDNSTFIFFVDDDLNRAKEKTYIVKAQITLEDAGTKKGEPVIYNVNFKINLKK